MITEIDYFFAMKLIIQEESVKRYFHKNCHNYPSLMLATSANDSINR
jgi:hypothetical protein